MKKNQFLFLLLCFCFASLAAFAQTMTEWDDVTITSLNRIQSHDLGIPYADAEAAHSLDMSRSPWFLDLNGTWKFRWSALPSKVPSGFYADSYNVSTWDNIGVFVMIPQGTIVENLVVLDDLLQGNLETLSAELASRVVVPLRHLALLGIASLGNDEKHCPSCCDMSDVT